MPQTLLTRARRVLVERFGHADFQKGQWEPIRAVLEGQDALVVIPLIALMKDQQDKLAAQGVDALAMHSHLSDAQARDLADRVSDGAGEMLYLTPERFKDRDFFERLLTRT